MKIAYQIVYLKKRFPLRISRGVRDGQHNLFVSVSEGEYIGWGETSPGVSEGAATAEEAQLHLEQFLLKHPLEGDAIYNTYDSALKNSVSPCALAALVFYSTPCSTGPHPMVA